MSPSGGDVPTQNKAEMRAAVVDIGSNSVRLVIYDGPARAPFPICNEKALCGLGRDMSANGALNPAAVEAALATLKRFRLILDEYDPVRLFVVATAAVREAKDGRDFVRAAEKLGFKLNVIDGAEEATLAALGVASLEPGATGLVGDMGGGSLELALVDDGDVKDLISLSIGPLRLMNSDKPDLKSVAKQIDAALSTVKWLKPSKGDMLFMVGGAWRAIARIHMRLRSHPLPILHHYEMSGKQAIEVCDLVAKQSRTSLTEIPGIPSKRIDTLPYASLVLKAVIERAKIKRVFVSAGGVREGLLYRELSKEEQSTSPLLAGAKHLAQRMSPDATAGEAVEKFIRYVFADETAAQQRVRNAACRLMDISAYIHPDMRGLHAFETVIRAPLYGVTHAERTAIALSLWVRYNGVRAIPESAIISLLSFEERQRAVNIGLAIRFAAALSPKAAGPLRHCRVKLVDDQLEFSGTEAIRDMMGDNPRKRLEALASGLGVPVVESYED